MCAQATPTASNEAIIQFDLQGTRKLPLGLSIEITGGRTYPLVKEGARIPFDRTETMSTADSFQMAMRFNVFLGCRPLAKDCLPLCHVNVHDVKWSSAGIPKVDLRLRMSENGELHISAYNTDKKKNDVDFEIQTAQVTSEDIEAALAAREAGAEHDAWIAEVIQNMLRGYKMIGEANDHYSIAKRKMGYFKKHEYRKARKELQKCLEVMPPEHTQETAQRLKEEMHLFSLGMKQLKATEQEVLKWWK